MRIRKGSRYILSVLNGVNALSMLTLALFLLLGNDTFRAELASGEAVSMIACLQIVITVLIGVIIAVYAELHKLKGENDGMTIIKESSKTARITVLVFLLADILLAIFFLKVQAVLYLFVCLMQAMCVLFCSRIIKRIV